MPLDPTDALLTTNEDDQKTASAHIAASLVQSDFGVLPWAELEILMYSVYAPVSARCYAQTGCAYNSPLG